MCEFETIGCATFSEYLSMWRRLLYVVHTVPGLLARLDHPHLVGLPAAQQSSGHQYF